MELDVIYPFCYNDPKIVEGVYSRFRNSINSLLNQKTEHKINICVSDCSLIPIIGWIQQKFPGKEFKYQHKPLRDHFNPSKVRNFGIRTLVTTDIFFLSDVDMIYPEGYISEMVALMTNGVVRITPQMRNEIKPNVFSCSEAPGNGAVDLKTFKEVRGFDEAYNGYGPEDQDLNARMAYKGLFKKEVHLSNTPTHQYHPPISPRTHERQNDLIWERRKGLLKTGHHIEVNPDREWGVL